MAYSIILAFTGEGPTDNRFIPNITERLLGELLLEQNKEATIQWQTIEKLGDSASEVILNASRQSKYCTTLIIHADADDSNPDTALTCRIQPGIDLINESGEELCRNITIVIPVHMTEAWMLVDKELLKEEINTKLSDNSLGLSYRLNRIESISDPKQKIEEVVRVYHNNLPKKRRKYAAKIEDLYEPISTKLELSKLEVLNAYNEFKRQLIDSLKQANILN